MANQGRSSKDQIVIPKEASQAMGVKGGDELLVVVQDDLTLVMPNPKRYAKALYGFAKGTYPRELPQARAPVVVETSLPHRLPVPRQPIGLHTNVFIDFLEDHHRLDGLV